MTKQKYLGSLFYDINKNRNKNQILFPFYSFRKKNWIKELTNIDSITYILIKEEVEELFYKTGGYLTYFDFESCYKIAVETTIKQVNKSIRKNKKCFFEIENDNNLLILQKIKSRILNNIRNFFSPNRKINYLYFQNYINQIEDSYENTEEIMFEIDIERIDKETLRNGLKIVWEEAVGDMDFDIEDFKILCERYGFTPLDVLIYNPYILPKMSKETCTNSNYQLLLTFEDIEKAA